MIERSDSQQIVRRNRQPATRKIHQKMNAPKPHILMVVENYFPSDTRVRNEAQTLKDNFQVSVVSLKREEETFHETWNGIEVFRIPELRLRKLKVKGALFRGMSKKISYMLYYLYFTLGAAAIFILAGIRRHYKVLHVHNPPDTLFILGVLAKMVGIKFVFDHHDLSPELFLTRFLQAGLVFKLLVAFEGLCCKLADVVIATNESYKRIDVERHKIDPAKVFIVRNDPVIAEWQQQEEGQGKKAKLFLLYVGCINPQDGVELLLRSLHHLVNVVGYKDFNCVIVGDGDSLLKIERMAAELKLDSFVEFPGYIYDRQRLMEYFLKADICLEPAPDNPLNRYSTFIKVMEYMAAGKPIVAFDQKETRYSTDSCAQLVPPGDIEGFARAIKSLIDDKELRTRLGKKGLERVEQDLNWQSSSLNLHTAYARLLKRNDFHPSAGINSKGQPKRSEILSEGE